MDIEKLLGKLLQETTGSGGNHLKKKYKKYKKKKYKGKKGYSQQSSSSHQVGQTSSLLGNLTGNLKSGKGLLTAIGLGVGAYEIYRTGKQAKQRQVPGAGGVGPQQSPHQYNQYNQYTQAPHANSHVNPQASPYVSPGQAAPPPPPPPRGGMQQQERQQVQPEQHPRQQAGVQQRQAVAPVQTELQEQDIACRLIQAMVAAAHADGHLDSDEEKAILDRLRDVELAQDEKMFLLEELHHPRSIPELIQGIEDVRLKQALYAVAASAVVIDTESERRWFDELGQALDISPEVCQFIEENH
ncbi:MAG: DUF533 domain-containing protein [Candidatus Electrothrix sp. AW3_4]|nr:DUF533 domain-containing protein [Candidatus Electrothrix gigas]